MEAIELSVIQAIQKIGCGFSDAVFAIISVLGETVIYAALVPVIYWCVNKSAGEEIALGIFSGSYYCGILKGFFQRLRPIVTHASGIRKGSIDVVYDLQIHDGQYLPESFPSGHTQASASFLSTVAYRKGMKRYWWLLLVPVAVAVSRLYFGLHWPTDVLCGFAVGCLVSMVIHIAMKKNKRMTFIFLPLISALSFIPCLFFEMPEKQVARCLMLLALIIGGCMGMYTENRFINFSTDNLKLSRRILRLPVGLLVLVLVLAVPFIVMYLCGLSMNEILVPVALLASFSMSAFVPAVFKKFKI